MRRLNDAIGDCCRVGCFSGFLPGFLYSCTRQLFQFGCSNYFHPPQMKPGHSNIARHYPERVREGKRRLNLLAHGR
jgi:hypothetical protein